MCLEISKSWEKLTTKFKKSKKGKSFFVYKDLCITDEGELKSIYNRCTWVYNKPKQSTRKCRNLTRREKHYYIVDKGFHFYTYRAHRSMYKFRVYKKDIVAVGRYCYKKSIVVTRATLIRG